MDIKSIITCPICHTDLDDTLRCPSCNTQYSIYHGVYDIVNRELSENQKILWKISDDDLETKASTEIRWQADAEWIKDYYSRLNDDTREGMRLQELKMNELLGSLYGCVCDLATGMGGMLTTLINVAPKDIQIVATDISKQVLAYTKILTDNERVSYVATDGRCMSIKDESFDFIVSRAAFGNIPESDKVAKELHRILKTGGRLIVEGSYIELGSASYELAKREGLADGMVEEILCEYLRGAGFSKIESIVVKEAVWAENPYDLLPVAGDKQIFCVIQAVK